MSDATFDLASRATTATSKPTATSPATTSDILTAVGSGPSSALRLRRGFLVAAPLALELGLGFIMLRKPRKLPGATVGLDYALEYGTDRIEMQADAVQPGQRVVLLDDLLATGGTMAAGIRLLRQGGAVVPAAAALIELSFLGGRQKLDVPFEALLKYDS